MSTGMKEEIFYFSGKGPSNTAKVIELAVHACAEKGLGKLVVASSTGETALQARRAAGPGVDVIGVTYSAGSSYKDEVQSFEQNRARLEEEGIHIVKGLHALSATERGIQNKYQSGLLPLNIVADTLRMFGHGMKVCVEITLMAAEHGFITPEEDVVAMAGSHRGADTAVIIRPAYAANLFAARIRAILCMPV